MDRQRNFYTGPSGLLGSETVGDPPPTFWGRWYTPIFLLSLAALTLGVFAVLALSGQILH
jgi:hypothetical protein